MHPYVDRLYTTPDVLQQGLLKGIGTTNPLFDSLKQERLLWCPAASDADDHFLTFPDPLTTIFMTERERVVSTTSVNDLKRIYNTLDSDCPRSERDQADDDQDQAHRQLMDIQSPTMATSSAPSAAPRQFPTRPYALIQERRVCYTIFPTQRKLKDHIHRKVNDAKRTFCQFLLTETADRRSKFSC